MKIESNKNWTTCLRLNTGDGSPRVFLLNSHFLGSVPFDYRVLKVTDYSFVSSSEGVVSTTTTSVCSTGNTGSEVLVSILR